MMKKAVCIHLFSLLFVILPGAASAKLSPDLLKSAEGGDASAQYAVARAYELGKHVKSNKKQTILWYSKAAEQGHLEASYRLGLIYYKGVGGYEINLAKAFHYISMAARGNHKRSQAHLAKMYENGDGVAKDEVLSDYWYEQAFSAKIQSLSAFLEKRKQSSQPIASSSRSKSAAKSTSSAFVFPNSLLRKNWYTRNESSHYLPSELTECSKRDHQIVCHTDKLDGTYSLGKFTYKVKSFIEPENNGEKIKITYRKLYVSVPEPRVEAYDEELSTAKAQELVIGWEKNSHTIFCDIENSAKILCRPVGADAFYLNGK